MSDTAFSRVLDITTEKIKDQRLQDRDIDTCKAHLRSVLHETDEIEEPNNDMNCYAH